MAEMNSVERERNGKRREETNVVFWIERLSLLVLIFFPTFVFGRIFCLALIATTFATLAYFWPNLSSVGPCGIGEFWLFLLDRLTFYLGIEYTKRSVLGIELPFLWHLTVFLFTVIHSIYIVEHLLRYIPILSRPPRPSQNDETPLSTGNVSKMEKVAELDGKKIVTDMEQMIHSCLETLRGELGEFRDELSNDGKKMMNKVEHMVCLQLGTLRDNMRLKVDEILKELRDELRSKVDAGIEDSREDFDREVKSIVEQLNKSYLSIQEIAKAAADKAHESYLVIQETAEEAKTTAEKAQKTGLIFRETTKKAKTTADKAHDTHLIFQQNQNKRQMIKGEDVEGFCELREEVQRMSVEAEIAAEELSRATVKLVEAGIQQWEEDNADYLASLPLLYSNHN